MTATLPTNVAAGAGAMHPSRLDATGPQGAPAATSPSGVEGSNPRRTTPQAVPGKVRGVGDHDAPDARLCSCKARSVIRYTWPGSVTETAYCGSCALETLSWEPALRWAITYGMGASI